MLSIPIIIFHILTLNIGSVKTKTITRHVRASVVNNRKSSDERNKTSRVNKFQNMFPIFFENQGDALMTNKLNLHIDDLLSYTDDISTL